MASRRRHPPTMHLQDTVRLSADGLAKVLGDLEARIMTVMWDLAKPAPARAIHEVVVKEHEVASLTVITVLNKLVGKGLLRRERQNDLYHYRPTVSRDEFMARASRRVVEGIMALAPDAVAASFVDVLSKQDPEKLSELARLIRRRLREQDTD